MVILYLINVRVYRSDVLEQMRVVVGLELEYKEFMFKFVFSVVCDFEFIM